MSVNFLAEAVARRDAAAAELDAIADRLEAEHRRCTDDEEQRVDALLADLRDARHRVDEIETSQAARKAALPAIGRGGTGPSVRVRSEPGIYRRDARENEPGFFRDMFLAGQGDFGAVERLARHSESESRDATTANLAGVVPPAYLPAMVADYARNGRPFANICEGHSLPANGMTVNLSKVTTPSTVAAQASENGSISNQDVDDTLLSIDVRTIAGFVDVSRQALERGVEVDQLIFRDLALAYATELDSQIINAAGTSGTHLGVLNATGTTAVSYTDATPTVAELWPKIADAARQVSGGIFQPATHVVMHSRRWAWLMAALDGDNRPLIVPDTSGTNAMGSGGIEVGVVGTLMGLPVVVSDSIPTNLGAGTNEDTILVVHSDELHLWENSATPMTIRAESVLADQLTVRLVAYGYSAFTAERRPKAIATIGGTGLINPW